MPTAPGRNIANQPTARLPSHDPTSMQYGIGQTLVTVMRCSEQIDGSPGVPSLDGNPRMVRPRKRSGRVGLTQPVDFERAVRRSRSQPVAGGILSRISSSAWVG